jgi:hypothetical protein
MQKQRKTKYQIAETKQISSQNYTITPKHKANLQKLNTNTKLQKLKGRRNTKIIAETDEIPNSWIHELVLGIKPRFIKPALIPC